uniref:Uncharacterized protein n=1 Tax=mine drainage metagenome TaxID=410659 RepID=E6QJQ9_9ZZZZ
MGWRDWPIEAWLLRRRDCRAGESAGRHQRGYARGYGNERWRGISPLIVICRVRGSNDTKVFGAVFIYGVAYDRFG